MEDRYACSGRTYSSSSLKKGTILFASLVIFNAIGFSQEVVSPIRHVLEGGGHAQDYRGYRSVANATPPAVSGTLSTVGVYTSLDGYADYQTNGGACQYIRVDSASGRIYVTYMVLDDSTNANTNGVAFALSTNAGITWSNFSNLRLPQDVSFYPALDLGRGPLAGVPIIANQYGIPRRVSAFVGNVVHPDSFSQVPPPASTLLRVPAITSASDGSIIMEPFDFGINKAQLFRTTDLQTWSSPVTPPDTPASSLRNVLVSNSSGRVGSLMNAADNGLYWFESTDNGLTWPVTALQIHPPIRIAGNDSMAVWVGSDVVYQGNEPLVVFDERRINTTGPDSARIMFWSRATGFVTAASKGNTPGVVTALNRPQTNHITVCYPVIGLSGSHIVVAYIAFMSDTSSSGFNYADVFIVTSSNAGASWSTPRNLTNSPQVDERYPSISKWNAAGQVNLVWQEDAEPGTWWAFNEGPITRNRQVFYRDILTNVEENPESPREFVLFQNYPNPFNPTTTIKFTVKETWQTKLDVWNILGQHVATLFDGVAEPGRFYHVNFDASKVASGVYMYSLQSGNKRDLKKLVVLK
ncbi:MAG: T9SS type A sorting domain-containing protein [Bacteroidetes bacterium]|nr:T9SS type A sorting domain-containing protein [Bacteroidota bacterium]MCW5895014.1 T9SS type A sorting domain-containing protein [Bacteroidota bacterium]